MAQTAQTTLTLTDPENNGYLQQFESAKAQGLPCIFRYINSADKIANNRALPMKYQVLWSSLQQAAIDWAIEQLGLQGFSYDKALTVISLMRQTLNP